MKSGVYREMESEYVRRKRYGEEMGDMERVVGEMRERMREGEEEKKMVEGDVMGTIGELCKGEYMLRKEV